MLMLYAVFFSQLSGSVISRKGKWLLHSGGHFLPCAGFLTDSLNEIAMATLRNNLGQTSVHGFIGVFM